MAASAMSAGEVSRAARRDLQFRIPRRPVLRLGLRPRPQEETWVVDGARKSQVLAGAFAREHMGDLLRACDGSRTLAQIGQETGIGEQAAFEAVSLLWTGGIVEEGDTEALSGPPPAPELACLLSRLGDSTGVNDSWQDAARRLAAARVTIVGVGAWPIGSPRPWSPRCPCAPAGRAPRTPWWSSSRPPEGATAGPARWPGAAGSWASPCCACAPSRRPSPWAPTWTPPSRPAWSAPPPATRSRAQRRSPPDRTWPWAWPPGRWPH